MTTAGWTLRVVWPVEDPELFDAEAIAAARRDLPNVAAELNAVIVGIARFRVGAITHADRPATPAVECEVPAVPVAVAANRGECGNSHPFNHTNTYINPSGSRVCRQCARDARARHRRKPINREEAA